MPIPQGHISHKSLEILLPKILAATGQQFITWALIFLTLFSKILPPSVIKLLNDKLIATLYEKMPRNPTDLTGAVIDLPPDQMGKPNRPYARTVPVNGSAAAHAGNLPYVGLVFDKLLKRSKTEDWDAVSFSLPIFFRHYISYKYSTHSSRSTPVDSAPLHSLLVP
jgi:hypothetical protein